MDVNSFLLPIIKREVCRARHPQGSRNPSSYPSSASAIGPDGKVIGACQRADWYRIHGVAPTDLSEFYMQMVYALGKCIENLVVDGMKCAGVYESNSTRFFNPEYKISGELDIVGRYRPTPDTLGYYLVEVKSVWGEGVKKTIKGRTRSYKGQAGFAPYPKESNIMQVMIYTDHYDGSMGPEFKLDFSKLLYLPRDNPSDGREYTISLVKKSDLTPEFLKLYGENMVDGHKYALVQTEGWPDVVETRFSMEEIYRRYAEFKEEHLDKGIPPARSFSKFLSQEEIEAEYKAENISTSAYDKWAKKKPKAELGVTPGHYLCQNYCEWRSFCWNKDGSPNEEADKIGLVQIEERVNGEKA